MTTLEPRLDLSGHHFVQVINRRWCICCDLFQRRKYATHPWLPKRPGFCAKDTPYANALLSHRKTGE